MNVSKYRHFFTNDLRPWLFRLKPTGDSADTKPEGVEDLEPANDLKNENSPEIGVDEAQTESLFRKEAVEEQSHKLISDVLLFAPLRLTLVIIFYTVLALSFAAFMIFGSYQRKERVPGVLVPSQGLVQIQPKEDGRITQLFAQEGQQVETGSPLAKLSRESYIDKDARGKYAAAMEELMQEKQMLLAQVQSAEAKSKIQMEELTQKLANLSQYLQVSEGLVAIKTKQKNEAERTFNTAEKLYAEARLGRNEYEAQLQRFSSLADAAAAASRDRLDTLSAIRRIDLQKDLLKQETATNKLELEGKISALKQRQLDIEGKRDLVLLAPISGRISGLRANVGQSIAGDQVLLTIVPQNMQLEVQLFVPSRAAPFVKEGQTVRLQYESLAANRFGTFPGRVYTVSGAALDPKDLNDRRVTEPRYLVKVALDPKSHAAFFQALSLRAGLLLEADIWLDKRSLIQWVLDPLLRAQGGPNGVDSI